MVDQRKDETVASRRFVKRHARLFSHHLTAWNRGFVGKFSIILVPRIEQGLWSQPQFKNNFHQPAFLSLREAVSLQYHPSMHHLQASPLMSGRSYFLLKIGEG